MIEPRKTVLVIAGEFPPIKTIGRIRTAKFVAHLQEMGWQTVVLTLEPAGAYDPILLEEIDPGAEIIRVPNLDLEAALARRVKRLLGRNHQPAENANPGKPVPSQTSGAGTQQNPSFKSRLLKAFKTFLRHGIYIPDDYLPWALKSYNPALELCRSGRIDLIYTSLPPFSAALLGYRLKGATGIPWVVDYRDLWYGDVLREWVGPVRRRLELALERRLMTRADAIISVSEQKTAYLQRLLSHINPRWETLTNGYDPETFRPLLEKPRPIDDTIDFVYTGRLFKNRRGYAFAEALGRLKADCPDLTERVRVHILGGVSPEIAARYHEILEQYGISHQFRFTGDVGYHEAMQAQVECDYLLLIVDTGETSDGVIPGKLFEYVAARRPIFALCDPGATQDIIERGGLGRVIPAQSVEQCQTALAELLSQPVPHVLQRDEDYLSRFERRNISRRLAHLFDELSPSPQDT